MAERRNLPGTKRADLFAFSAEEKFEDMQGQFATQEFIQQLIREALRGVVLFAGFVPPVLLVAFACVCLLCFVCSICTGFIGLRGWCRFLLVFWDVLRSLLLLGRQRPV